MAKNMKEQAAAVEAAAVSEENTNNINENETRLLEEVAALKAEIAELKSEKAKAKADTMADPSRKEAIGELSNDNAEKVMFTVPLNELDHKDRQLDIGINGHHFIMKRGETVEVPKYVVLAYQESVKQQLRSYGLQDKYQKMVNLTE